MIKVNNNNFLLFSLLLFLFIIGCEEEGEENVIIGTWKVSKFEVYESMSCSGLLADTPFFDLFNYSETYIIRYEGFTWSQTSNLNENPYTEEGTYTVVTTDTTIIYTLLGTTTRHGIEGYREGYIGEDENSMSIKVQWDTDNDHIVDTCFNFNFDKIN